MKVELQTSVNLNLMDSDFSEVIAEFRRLFRLVLQTGFFMNLTVEVSGSERTFSERVAISGTGYITDDPKKRQTGAERITMPYPDQLDLALAHFIVGNDGRKVTMGNCEIRIIRWSARDEDMPWPETPGKQYDLILSFLREKKGSK